MQSCGFLHMGPVDIANSPYVDTRKGHTHSQDCRTIESGQISRDSLSDGCPEIAGVLDLGDAPRFGRLLCPMWFCTSSSSSRRSVQN